MKTSQEFEAAYQRTPVRIIGKEGSGVLSLQGDNTSLHISGLKSEWRRPKNTNGWFDLKVQSHMGRTLLLKNAITTGSNSYFGPSEQYDVTIYPNYLIEDYDSLGVDGLISEVSFTIHNMKDFFDYQHIEGHVARLSFAESKFATAIEKASLVKKGSGNFSPNCVYITHNFPDIFEFKIEDRTYRIFFGWKQNSGWHEISHSEFPVAMISFDKPVGFEAAYAAAWQWKRLFCQLASHPFSFETLSVRRGDGVSSSDVYSPSQAIPAESQHRFRPMKVYIPLNQWENRTELADAHKQWLLAEAQSEQFRDRLDNVIHKSAGRNDATDIVELSSAIESLGELDTGSTIPKSVLDSMTSAAVAEAKLYPEIVTAQRVRSLLGNIARQSLSAKIATLCAEVGVNSKDAALITKSVSLLRSKAAHGGTFGDQVRQLTSPTTRALMTLCIKYDLTKSGFLRPGSLRQATLIGRQYLDAIADLKKLNGK